MIDLYSFITTMLELPYVPYPHKHDILYMFSLLVYDMKRYRNILASLLKYGTYRPVPYIHHWMLAWPSRSDLIGSSTERATRLGHATPRRALSMTRNRRRRKYVVV